MMLYSASRDQDYIAVVPLWWEVRAIKCTKPDGEIIRTMEDRGQDGMVSWLRSCRCGGTVAWMCLHQDGLPLINVRLTYDIRKAGQSRT